MSADFWAELVWEPLKSRVAQTGQGVLDLTWSRLEPEPDLQAAELASSLAELEPAWIELARALWMLPDFRRPAPAEFGLREPGSELGSPELGSDH